MRRDLIVAPCCWAGRWGQADGVAAASAAAKVAAKPRLPWGSAGAAYQIEGGNYASDLWVMEHAKPTIFKDPSGDAADSYNRVWEDIALAASLGFNTHRFSIEWSRIEPEPGQVSLAGVAHYRRVLEAIRKHGMTPFVTYNHFTTPRWFAAAGGFETRDGISAVRPLLHLAGTQHLGDLIGGGLDFNEPNLGALVSWSPGHPAATALYRDVQEGRRRRLDRRRPWAPPVLGDFRIQQPIMIEAHERAHEAIRKASNDRYPVGVTLSLNDERAPPSGPSGVEAKQAQVMLPWLAAQGDFIGVQNYTYTEVGPDADLPPPRASS